MKQQSKLQTLLEMRKLPFYSKGTLTKKDRDDFERYNELEFQLETDARKLKKGDKVRFNFADKIKDKSRTFGFRLVDKLYEGTLYMPVKTAKRTRMGEDCSFETIKAIVGNTIYSLDLSDIEKI